MKRGFTLLELIVVVIIVGILSTMALTQYGRTIERSRSTEAKAIIGALRKDAATYFMTYGSLSAVTNADVGIGTNPDQAPSTCRYSHYFSYGMAAATPTITFTATRCTTGAGGKTPGNPIATSVILTSGMSSGIDNWSP